MILMAAPITSIINVGLGVLGLLAGGTLVTINAVWFAYAMKVEQTNPEARAIARGEVAQIALSDSDAIRHHKLAMGPSARTRWLPPPADLVANLQLLELEAVRRTEWSDQASRFEGFEGLIPDAVVRVLVSPANPYARARLAHIYYNAGRDAEERISAFRQALKTGRYNPRLAPLLLQMAAFDWTRLTNDDHGLIYDQCRYLAKADIRLLGQLALEPGIDAITRAALSDDEDAMKAFEKARYRAIRDVVHRVRQRLTPSTPGMGS